MQLTPEMFEEIVSALGNCAGEAPLKGEGAEHRASKRLIYNADVRVVRHGTRHAVPEVVQMRDLSRTGCSFVGEKVMQGQEHVVMYLPRGGERYLPLLCTVRNCRVTQDGFRVGVQFVSEEEHKAEERGIATGAQGVVMPGTPAPFGPQRKQRDRRVRQSPSAGLIIIDADGKQGPIENVELLEAGKEQVGIWRRSPLMVGQKVLLMMPRTREARAGVRLCEVLHIRPHDGETYHIGMKFLPSKGIRVQAAGTGGGLVARLKGWFAA